MKGLKYPGEFKPLGNKINNFEQRNYKLKGMNQEQFKGEFKPLSKN